MRAFDFAADQPWVLTEKHLNLILDISQRVHEPDWEAVALKQAERVDKAEILQMRGDVAVINVTGPIFRYANLFTAFSGATSVQELATRFGEARDGNAKAIVLNIDSPGGEVAGISELAKAIYDARGTKPIIAYADDLAASGGYWLAAAADKIVAADTARLGSIGVIATIVDRQTDKPGAKTYQFISSVSPKKRADMNTEEGRGQIQMLVDDLADVFVAAVARNRGVTVEKVLADFGQGSTLIASRAVSAGMADAIGTFEGLISSLGTGERPALFSLGGAAANIAKEEVPVMGADTKTPAAEQPTEQKPEQVNVGAIRAEAAKAERDRIGGIITCDEATGRDQLARMLALETETSVEAAKKILAASPKAVQTASNPLAGAMATVPNPKVGTDSGDGSDDVQATVQAILATVKGGK